MDASSDDDRVFDPFLQEGEVDLEFDPMVGNDDGDEDTYWLSEQQDRRRDEKTTGRYTKSKRMEGCTDGRIEANVRHHRSCKDASL